MLYALLALTALMFGLYNVFIKMSSSDINPVLGAVVLQFVAAFLGLAFLLYLRLGARAEFNFNTRGLSLAVLAGVAIGLVEMLTFFVYGRGVPVAIGNPLIIGGSLLVTTGLGVLALREHLSPTQSFAIGLIFVAVCLMAWDASRA